METKLHPSLTTSMTYEDTVVQKTVDFVRNTLANDTTGHDWWHIYRVWQTALYIAEQEQADTFLVQLGALLHDIADWKFHEGDEKASARVARGWLLNFELPEAIIESVCDIINEVTFKGAGVKSQIKTLEGKIVQDADRLDALGAMGIARAFTYGGYKQRPLYDPAIKPVLHSSFEAYKNHQGTTINHFYEKLLLLKDLMNTATAKQLAQTRHQFMEEYLAHFFAEWNIALK
jgi:uncharacterized protein